MAQLITAGAGLGCMIDAHRVSERLWMGSRPMLPAAGAMKRYGFDVLVLCAEEVQPPSHHFPGVRVIRAPLDDAEVTTDLKRTAVAAAHEVAAALLLGERVLVTCNQGRNRSGLVAALALVLVSELDGAHAAAQVQASRPRALVNPHFVRWLREIR